MARPSWAAALLLSTSLTALLGAGPGAPEDAGAGTDGAPSGSVETDAAVAEPAAAAPQAPDVAPPPKSAAAPPASAKGAGPLEDSPTLHSAFVHVFVDYPDAVLELRSYIDDTDWTEACRAPCDRTLRVEGMDARVRAPGMTASNVFRIDPGRGTANLKVEGGSLRSKTIGTVGFASGIPLGLVGMGLWSYGKLEDRASLQTAGIVTMGVAAALVLGSLPFLSAGGTRVRDGKGKVIATSFAPPRL